jgi:hypothetical protein
MNRLPNAHLAAVDESKITGYLLSDSHPVGRSKAAYFRQFGFQVSSWRTLRDALVSHLEASEVTSVVKSEFGTKYIVEGALCTPDRREPRIIVVWFVATGTIVPKLVTAYPARGGQQ